MTAFFGAEVSGSDRAFSAVLQKLADDGFDVYVGSDTQHALNAELTVFSSAVPPSDAERVAAGTRQVERCVFLGMLSKLFPRVLAVAGTHGKTTVTGMLASIYQQANRSFTAHLGGYSHQLKGGLALHGNGLFITEACEFKRSFLQLFPDTSLILNAEYDHPDCYPCRSDLYSAFNRFALNTRHGGRLIVGSEIPQLLNICTNEHIDICEYGKDFRIENMRRDTNDFTLRYDGKALPISLICRGEHNAHNAAFAAYAALLDGVSESDVATGLHVFSGIARRLERLGTFCGAEVITDYAHHPTEIAAAIASVSGGYGVTAVFEPHTFSRTAGLFDQFVTAFAQADRVIILPTYAARETAADGVEAKTLFCALDCKEKYYAETYEQCRVLLTKLVRQKETLLLLGAGNINQLAYSLVNADGC